MNQSIVFFVDGVIGFGYVFMNHQVDFLCFLLFGRNYHPVYLKSYWGDLYSFTVELCHSIDSINSIVEVLNYL
ncbi:uncharacterized protein METZ01_LOCUS335817 [marine metagenome]|uniref:Uncharacterized protein n=1 Tax=marine metagenome TaxID=408172 RepID=A0A382QBP5_9ZZZZ